MPIVEGRYVRSDPSLHKNSLISTQLPSVTGSEMLLGAAKLWGTVSNSPVAEELDFVDGESIIDTPSY